MDEQPIDLKPFLKGGLLTSLADVLYSRIFQPIDNLLERISSHFTRKWCESNTPKR
jgi:hypothetical protein